MKTVLITGATGKIGREVIARSGVSSFRARALTRSPEAANLPPEIEVFGGDLSQPASLEPAVRNVNAVFLVWTLPLDTAAPAIELMAKNVGRIVFLSAPIYTQHPFFQQPNPIRHLHASIEQLIRDSGAEWTILRPGPFAANARTWWAQQIRNGDVVRWPFARAESAPIHEVDVAEIAVRALLEDGKPRAEYVLTGPESLTQAEQVRILGDAIGRNLRFEEITREVATAEVLSAWPPYLADMLFGAYEACIGIPAYRTDTFEQVTGKSPRTFLEWARDHAAEFQRIE